MDWLLLAVFSALFLGVYDVAKKWGLDKNAVLPVLWTTSLCGVVLVIPWYLLSALTPSLAQAWMLQVVPLPWHAHLLVLSKAAIVTTSWLLTYFAIKHLPISLASPIRASAPLFTILGAVALFAEMPSIQQWTGIIFVFAGYWGFSVLGKKEGVHFSANHWVWMLFAGTAVAACSGLYDKVLLQKANLDPVTVQFWFTIYNALLQAPLVLFLWYPRRRANTPFQWRWSIPLVALLLIVADYFYFRAMSNPAALVSVVSVVRRSNVLISFLVGGIAFRERNRRRKGFVLILVAVGILLILL